MRLAFFGAFNPPTVAHLNLAGFALRATGSEQVIFVPSKSAYICNEQRKDFAYSNEQRLSMLRKAAESRPWMAVTDWELQQDRQPRTYETLCHLREEGIPSALLIGSDKLAELEHSWLHVPEIIREFGIVCLVRGGDHCVRMIQESPFLSFLSSGIRILETPEETQGISSTAVRGKVRDILRLQTSLSGLVPPEIMPLLFDIRSESESAGSV